MNTGKRSNMLRTPGWRACAASTVRKLGAGLIIVATLLFPSLAAQEIGQAYIVGPNDALTITVFDNPQLTGRYIVQNDGTFTFPLLGSIKAGGVTLQAVEHEIRERLAKGYLKNPQLSVSVEQYRSQRVFVMGEVRQPGGFEFTGHMTLIDALARVGSTTDRAGGEAIVVRPPLGAPSPEVPSAAKVDDVKNTNAEVIRVDLQRLQGGTLSENIALRGGDTIFVPRAEPVFVSGQVRSAGEFVVRKGMTVRQVIALAGGTTERGSTRRIQIIRQVAGKEVTISVTLQDQVQPGDTVVVRERFF